jgi:hypothetical protein
MTDKRRAGCGESRMPGSEGGVGKQARDHIGQPKAPCSYPTEVGDARAVGTTAGADV